MSLVRVRRAAAGLFVVAGLALATPAFAQSPEAEAVGVSLAHDLSSALNLKQIFVQVSKQPGAAASILGREPAPGTEVLFQEAVAEEIAHDLPAVERSIGRALARRFAVKDLKAATGFLKTRGGQAFLRVIEDTAAGRPSQPLSPEEKAELATFFNSPEGQALDAVLADFHSVLDAAGPEVMAEVTPGITQRYNAKLAKAGK